jgi:predicted nuclease of predicted toxin-antitoxin system
MRFLIDTQLPAALKPLIAAGGFSVEHVLDLDMGRAKDTAIWDYAKQVGAAIVSKDEDFILKLHRVSGPQIVWSVTATCATECFSPVLQWLCRE